MSRWIIGSLRETLSHSKLRSKNIDGLVCYIILIVMAKEISSLLFNHCHTKGNLCVTKNEYAMHNVQDQTETLSCML